MKPVQVKVYDGKIEVGHVLDYLSTSSNYYDPNGVLYKAIIPMDNFYQCEEVRNYFFDRFALELKKKL